MSVMIRSSSCVTNAFAWTNCSGIINYIPLQVCLDKVAKIITDPESAWFVYWYRVCINNTLYTELPDLANWGTQRYPLFQTKFLNALLQVVLWKFQLYRFCLHSCKFSFSGFACGILNEPIKVKGRFSCEICRCKED